MNTVRLTTAQALVRYLQAQWSERDGDRRRLIPGMWGIFGHGNVIGLGQALEEVGDELTFHQGRNEQSMVHAAAAFAKATRRRQTLACTASIGPARRTWSPAPPARRSTACRCSCSPGDIYATRHQGPVLQQLEHATSGRRHGERLLPPGRALLRPDHAARAAADRAARGDARAHLAGRDRRGRARAAAGRPVARVGLPRALLRASASGASSAPLPDPRRIAEAAELIRAAERPLRDRRAAACSTARPRTSCWSSRATTRHPGRRDVRGQGRRAGRRVVPARRRRARGQPGGVTRWRWTPTSSSPSGTRLTDFATGSNSLFQHPDVRFVADQRRGAATRTSRARCRSSRDAREALAALRDALERLVDGRGVPRRGDAARVPSGSSSARRSADPSTARR